MDGDAELALGGVDLEHPNAARIYDYLLGGQANYAVDRLFGERAVENLPIVKTLAQVNREYLGRAVRYCLRNGVNQFLDIGSGVPTVGNVHRVADAFDSQSRCVYVDYEPVAVAHATVLLENEGDPDRHAVIQATMQHVDEVWDAALRTGVLDPDKPIALLMVALLHFVPPEKGAYEAVARYRKLLPPGSHLIVSHVTESGIADDLLAQIRGFVHQYQKSSTPACFRTPEEIAAFFGDLDMIDPGLVWLPQWHLNEGSSPETETLVADPSQACVLGGIARKPG